MEVKFIKASPTENMTLLIETPVAREKQLAVAERLIAYGSVYAEQAGYIEEAENPAAEKRLQMMAGEFCGLAEWQCPYRSASKREHLRWTAKESS